jgi:predicted transposase YdaD
MKSAAQEWFEEGEVSGLQKGEVIGLQKGRQSTILQILQYRFALTAEMTSRMSEQLSRIEQIETLETLTNLALQVFALPEFQQRLTALSSPPTPATATSDEA